MGTVNISKAPSVKVSELVNPLGVTTLVKVMYLPTANPWEVLLTVTILEPSTVSKSAPVIAVSKGVMS